VVQLWPPPRRYGPRPICKRPLPRSRMLAIKCADRARANALSCARRLWLRCRSQRVQDRHLPHSLIGRSTLRAGNGIASATRHGRQQGCTIASWGQRHDHPAGIVIFEFHPPPPRKNRPTPDRRMCRQLTRTYCAEPYTSPDRPRSIRPSSTMNCCPGPLRRVEKISTARPSKIAVSPGIAPHQAA